MREQVRTLKRGVQRRYVVDFQIGDFLVDTNPGAIGMEFASSVLEIVQAQWRDIRKPARDETLARRERSRRSSAGKSYKSRYTGGRIGHTPPTTSIRYGIDSGRTVDHLTLRPRRRNRDESVITLNTPANRFKESQWPGSASQMTEYLGEMRKLVPLLGGKADARTQIALSRALTKHMRDLYSVNEARFRQLLRERNRRAFQVARAAARAFL